jgi:cell wall-associated NlpC family hydrolase
MMMDTGMVCQSVRRREDMAHDIRPIDAAGGAHSSGAAAPLTGPTQGGPARTDAAAAPTSTHDGFAPSDALLDEDDDPQAEDAKKADQANQTQESDPERERLQKEIEDKQKQLKEALAKGDYDSADQLMHDIEGLVSQLQDRGGPVRPPQTPPSDPVPTLPPAGTGGGGTGGGVPAGNIPYFGGDAPPMYGSPGGGPRQTGGNAMSPAQIDGIRGNLPDAGDRSGLVNTGLDIAKQGLPYVWGGNGPQDGGYDCSGFTKAVYGKNGINIPRTAQTQYDYCKNQGSLMEGRGTDMLKNAKPGDLLFFDNPYAKKTSDIGHVMMYLGDGKMVGAQSKGVSVYDVSSMGNYLRGVGRPQ